MEVPKCPQCKKRFDLVHRRPLHLPKCGHLVCVDCMSKQIKSNSSGSFTCLIDSLKYTDVKSTNDFKTDENILKSIQDNRSKKCTEHSRPFEFFCIEDEIEICSICALMGSHKGHHILVEKDLFELTKREQQELDHQLSTLEIGRELRTGENVSVIFKRVVTEKLKICKDQIDVLYKVV